MKRMHQGQSTLEYAVLISVVSAACLGIAIYINRGFQGRFRRAADFIGPLYGPGLVQSAKELTTLKSNSTQTIKLEGEGTSRTSLVSVDAESETKRERTETLADNTGKSLFEF